MFLQELGEIHDVMQKNIADLIKRGETLERCFHHGVQSQHFFASVSWSRPKTSRLARASFTAMQRERINVAKRTKKNFSANNPNQSAVTASVPQNS